MNCNQIIPSKVSHKINGWVFLDKPSGITSNQALSIVKRQFGIKRGRKGKGTKSGFAGTLDPLASGLLPIAIGEATKVLPYVVDDTKVYEFTVKWGQGTDTDDAEGQIIAESGTIPTLKDIQQIIPQFTCTIAQIPPKFAAVKVAGKRAYDLARQGEQFELSAKNITVHQLRVLQSQNDFTKFEVKCGKGTYVRALARDMAESLGTVGHITQLRRLKIGDLTVEQAVQLDDLKSESIQDIETVIPRLPVLEINQEQKANIRQGRAILCSGCSDNTIYRLKCDSVLVALAQLNNTETKPIRVFNIP